MALIEMNFASSGDSNPEWSNPTVTGSVVSASWNYDADTYIFTFTLNGYLYIGMYDLLTTDFWYASNPNGGWTHYGADARVSVHTKREIVFNFSGTMTNVSGIALVGKPTGYYS